MKKYYIDVNGRAFGPFTLDVLQGMIEKGRITPESRVSVNRIDWIAAGDIPDLFAPEQTSNGLELAPSELRDERVWMINQDGSTEYGPYTAAEIVAALKDGRITSNFYVRRVNENAPRLISDEPTFARACGPAESPAGSGVAGGAGGAREWYYSLDGVTAQGPYTVDELLNLVKQGTATIDAIVWRGGDDNSRPMRSDPTLGPLARALYTRGASPSSPSSVSSFSGQGVGGASSSGVAQPRGSLSDFYGRLSRRLSRSFAAIWISASALLVLALVLGLAAGLPGVGLGLVIFAILASIISFFFFVHALWSGLPREYARSSPGLAVGIFFIPLVGYYWAFHITLRAVRSLNELLTQYASVGARMGEYPRYAKTWHAVLFSCGYFLLNLVASALGRMAEAAAEESGVPAFAFVQAFVITVVVLVPTCLFLAPIKSAAKQFFLWSASNAADYERASERPVTLDDVLRG